MRRIGLPLSPALALRSRLAVAGTLEAARLALEDGIACNTAGGSHHAARGHGAGFCVFNDVAVAAAVLLAEGRVGRILVVDLDVHQGDGTAEIVQDLKFDDFGKEKFEISVNELLEERETVAELLR